MPAPFKLGDRVRLTEKQRHPANRAGDTGTIMAVMPSLAGGGPELYQVRMDEGKGSLYPAFYADELEQAE